MGGMKALPDLKQLTDKAKDVLMVVMWEELIAQILPPSPKTHPILHTPKS